MTPLLKIQALCNEQFQESGDHRFMEAADTLSTMTGYWQGPHGDWFRNADEEATTPVSFEAVSSASLKVMEKGQAENSIAGEVAWALQQHFESKKLLEAWKPGRTEGLAAGDVLRPVYTYTTSFESGPQRSVRLCLLDSVAPGGETPADRHSRILSLVATKGEGADAVSYPAGEFFVGAWQEAVRQALFTVDRFCASNEEDGEDNGVLEDRHNRQSQRPE